MTNLLKHFTRVCLSDKNFPTFVAASLLSSCMVGWICFEGVSRTKPTSFDEYSNDHTFGQKQQNSMSRDEAMVRAMIENARDSSASENISNAILAHERFVLPEQIRSRNQMTKNDKDEEERLVNKIVQRSDDILNRHRRQKELKDDDQRYSSGKWESYKSPEP